MCVKLYVCDITPGCPSQPPCSQHGPPHQNSAELMADTTRAGGALRPAATAALQASMLNEASTGPVGLCVCVCVCVCHTVCVRVRTMCVCVCVCVILVSLADEGRASGDHPAATSAVRVGPGTAAR